MARSLLVVSCILATLLGGCIGGPGRDTLSLAAGPAGAQRTVAVPTRLSAGGRGETPSSLVILGLN